MPKINITVAHTLTQAEAAERIRKRLEEVKTQFVDKIEDMHEEWNGNSCKFSLSVMGLTASGTMNVKEAEVEIVGQLPFEAFLFKNKIESVIKDKLKQMLA